MTSSPISAARSQYLLDLLAQIPDPRKKRGRRRRLAGLLAAGIAAVIAGSRSFAAIGQQSADVGPDVLAGVSPATLAAWIRGHQEIENRLHWVRDVAYQEDKSLVRTGNAPA